MALDHRPEAVAVEQPKPDRARIFFCAGSTATIKLLKRHRLQFVELVGLLP